MLRKVALAVAAFAVMASSAAAATSNVYFRNLNTNAIRPPVLFFAFDNGPRMDDIQWYGWGTRRAIGYGGWMARAVGSVGDDELDVRPARVILTDPKRVGADPSTVPSVPPGSRFYCGFKLITWDSGYKKHVEQRHVC